MLISKLVPGVAESVEVKGDIAARLFPEEQEQISRAVPKRRAEYTSVRACAREALGRLGIPETPLLRGDRGAPRWPAGVVGSMTHCSGYRAAAVAWESQLAALGIDAETHHPLPVGVFETVSIPEERISLRSLPETVHWDRVLFSAKESTYKAWYPLTGRWLDFHEALIDVRSDGSFTSSLLVPGPFVGDRRVDRFEGRWAVADDLVLTCIAVPMISHG